MSQSYADEAPASPVAASTSNRASNPTANADEAPYMPIEDQAHSTGNSRPLTPEPLTLEERIRMAEGKRNRLAQEKKLRDLNIEIEGLLDDARYGTERRRTAVAEATRSKSPTPGSQTVQELQPEKLKEYRGQNVRAHSEWTRSAENAFRLAPRKFQSTECKISWAAQFLKGTPQTTWQNIACTPQADKYSWVQFKELLLNLIEDPANRQLATAQQYHDTVQKPHQSTQEFNQQLIALECQLNEEYTQEQLRTHL